jgi:hypothetical protein
MLTVTKRHVIGLSYILCAYFADLILVFVNNSKKIKYVIRDEI